MGEPGKVTLLQTISDVTGNIQDVMLNPIRQQVAVRTKDNNAPIKVYDYEGKKVGDLSL